MKGNKIILKGIVGVHLMLVLACKSEPEIVFEKSDVAYVEILKDIHFPQTHLTVIYDKDNISKLFDGYLNNSSEAFGKVGDAYRIRIQRTSGVADTVYLERDMYKSRKIRTRKMKTDATSFIELLFSS
jgi:hypothetical protein